MESGIHVGPYEILALIGKGGMGEVYRARDTRLDRIVAIKRLPAQLAGEPFRLARFEREAKILASLNHPNIAAVYALEEHDGQRFLVMEFVEGRTLAARLREDRVPMEEAVEIALRIAEALEAAHDKGIIHRDLKPGNVMLTPDGKVKVLDFGLARGAGNTSGGSLGADDATHLAPTATSVPDLESLTLPGEVIGTAGYMSPEQARGKSLDRRTDIFSFGCVLYELLTGRRAFPGETLTDLLAAIVHREPDWAPLPAAFPMLRRVLERCLEKDVARRYRDIGDVALDLRTSLSTAESAPRAERRGRARVASAVAVVAALVAVALAAMLWRQRPVLPPVPEYDRLTYTPQFINNARFVPKSLTVVFSAARAGNTSELFVWRPEQPWPQALGGQNIQLLSVSATGELAVLTRPKYLYHRTYVGTLARMPISDTTPREVLEGVSAADFSPDGTELAIIRHADGRSLLEYPVGNVLAESAGWLSDLRIAPDGRHLAFMAHDLPWDNRGPVVVIDRAGREVARSPVYKGEDGLAWSGDSTTVYFTAYGDKRGFSLRAVSLDGSVHDVLTAPTDLVMYDCLPSGRMLLSTRAQQRHTVWRLGTENTESLDPSLGDAYPVALSADGRGMLMTDESVHAGDNYAVVFRPDPRTPPVRLGEGVAQDLSADGTTVLAAIPSDPPRLVLYPIGPGAVKDISFPGFVSYKDGVLLPGMRRVLVRGSERGGGQRCYIRDLDSGQVHAVTPEGAAHARVSPDGRSVVARTAQGAWHRHPIEDGAAIEGAPTAGEPVPGLGPDDEVIRWSADGRSLWIFQPSEVPTRIERVELATGLRTVGWELAGFERVGVTRFWTALVSADETSYALCFDRVLSVLYTVEGVR